jgi:hypothetical protein
MSYKLLKEDEKSFVIQHPDGSQFPVAKKGLTKATIDKIKGMGGVQQMYDGGRAMPTNASFMPTSSDLPFEALKQQPYQMTPQPAPIAPKAQDTVPFPQISQEAVNFANKLNDPFGVQKQQRIIEGAGAEQAKIYGDMEKIQNQYQMDQENEFKRFEERRKSIADEMDGLAKQIQEKKIDPNRLWNNKSTGDKIMSSIALVLGGIGGALTGRDNAALKIMQSQIDADIDAQKADQTGKESLYQMALKKYGNEQDAYQAARLNANVILKSKLDALATKSNSKDVQSKAALMSAQIGAEASKQAQELAKTMMMQQGMSPEMRKIQQLPSNLQAKAIEELGQYNQAKADLNRINEMFKVAQSIGPDDVLKSPEARQRLTEMPANLFPLVKSVTQEAMQEGEYQRLVGPFLPNASDSKERVEQKRKGLYKLLQSRMPNKTPTLQGYGIIVNPQQIIETPIGDK